MPFLTKLPLWASALLIVVLPTVLAMIGPLMIRRQVSFTRLSTNNEVAGFKFAVVGVLYAVMVAFAVVVVWQNFDDAEMTVTKEAGAAAIVYRLSMGLESDAAAALDRRLTAYLEGSIGQDWPAMGDGRGSPLVARELTATYRTVLGFNPPTSRQSAIVDAVLHQLEVIGAMRRARIVLAAGVMPGIVWWVLFGGAVMTIGFAFFFGAENLLAQTLMTGMLAVLIFSALLVIIAIDRPFAGPVHVSPHALEEVVGDFTSNPGR